jgi:hypothetical protein
VAEAEKRLEELSEVAIKDMEEFWEDQSSVGHKGKDDMTREGVKSDY